MRVSDPTSHQFKTKMEYKTFHHLFYNETVVEVRHWGWCRLDGFTDLCAFICNTAAMCLLYINLPGVVLPCKNCLINVTLSSSCSWVWEQSGTCQRFPQAPSSPWFPLSRFTCVWWWMRGWGEGGKQTQRGLLLWRLLCASPSELSGQETSGFGSIFWGRLLSHNAAGHRREHGSEWCIRGGKGFK